LPKGQVPNSVTKHCGYQMVLQAVPIPTSTNHAKANVLGKS